MTTYTEKGTKPLYGQILGFDHVHFWVGNAVQAANYYVTQWGFSPLAYRGLETGSRSVMTQVVAQNQIIFAFSSPLTPRHQQFNHHTARHGDSVKDIAFRVTDCRTLFAHAVAHGAISVSEPQQFDTPDGTCVVATIQAGYEGGWHTLVERTHYNGVFLPEYQPVEEYDPAEPQDSILKLLPPTHLQFIDHCVVNQPEGHLERVVDWYNTTLGFHRFWSVDDTQIHTKYTSLNSCVVADYDETIKLTVIEPAKGKRKSQIQEFLEYNDGPGVQHIAFSTNEILQSVLRLRQRRIPFISVPPSYYEDLRKRLDGSLIKVSEDLDKVQKLGIMIDFDDIGYLLQIVSHPAQDRPTLFFEVIQRHSHDGFGVGNFKNLFQAVEHEQDKRGNLHV